MEFSISGDDLGTGGTVNNDRNTYVALAGNWGVAGIGQVDTPYKSSTASLELFISRLVITTSSISTTSVLRMPCST